MSKRTKKLKQKELTPTIPTIVDPLVAMQENEERKTDDLSLQGLAKDPDLQDELDAIHQPIVQSYLGRRWTVYCFQSILDLVRQHQGPPGNTIYQWWLDRTEYVERWGHVCTHHADDFLDHPNHLSWEEKAVRFFESCDNDVDDTEKEAARILDFRQILDEGTPAADADWETRLFLFGLAPQCPLQCLGFSDKTDTEDHSKYWNKTDVLEPFLKMATNPLTLVWLIAASLLGHPWAAVHSESETTIIEVIEDLQAKDRAKRARKRGPPSEVIDLASNSASDGSGDPSDRSGDFSFDSALDSVTVEDGPPIKQLAFATESSEVESPAPTTTTTTKQIVRFSRKDKSEPAHHSGGATDRGRARSPTPPTKHKKPPSKTKAAASGKVAASKSVVAALKSVVDKKSNTVTPNKSMQARAKGKPGVRTAVTTALPKPSSLKSPPARQNTKLAPAPATAPPPDPDPSAVPNSFKEALQLPPPFVTDDQKIKTLIQVDLSGLTFQNVCIFNISSGVNWEGSEKESASVKLTTLAKIREQLIAAFSEADEGLSVLPILDKSYKTRKLWISKEAEVAQKLQSWKDLKTYVDLFYDNGLYYEKKPEQARDRILRTRMRFGFNTVSDSMRYTLNQVFNADGLGGCFSTPLQFGSLTKIGALADYPIETNKSQLAKQLMAIMDFKIPLAVEAKWPSSPGKEAREWNHGKDPQMLHVIVKTSMAAKVDRIFSLYFTPSTPKKDNPWGSPAIYIPDSRTAMSGVLGFEFTAAVKSAVARQLDQSCAFIHMSTNYTCPIKINGMLTPVPTTKFETCSLLKLLWSIKCTPEQAATATELAKKDSTATPAPPEDTSAATVSQLSSDFSKDHSAAPSSERRGMSGKESAAMDKAISNLLTQDEARRRPSPLFTHIVPSEAPGQWVFVTRQKYAALAARILSHLPAFLIYHLGEKTVKAEDFILRKWMDMNVVRKSRDDGLVWNPAELRATSEVNATLKMRLDEGMGFMEGMSLDTTEINWKGEIEIDLEMNPVKDLDDGLTVAGILDEARRNNLAREENVQMRVKMAELKAKSDADADRIALLEAALEASKMHVDAAATETAAHDVDGMIEDTDKGTDAKVDEGDALVHDEDAMVDEAADGGGGASAAAP